MNAKKVRKYLNELTSHLTFEFKGIPCGVDPLSKNHFEMWYGDKAFTARSIDEVMTVTLFDGKSLNEISDTVDFN